MDHKLQVNSPNIPGISYVNWVQACGIQKSPSGSWAKAFRNLAFTSWVLKVVYPYYLQGFL